MSDKVIEIEIYGQKYRIRVKGEEDEKYIGRLTSYVDQKMREVAVKSKSVDALKISVLAALNIADESFLTRKKLDQLNEVIGHMESKIESLEDYLLKDENTYKNIEEAKNQNFRRGIFRPVICPEIFLRFGGEEYLFLNFRSLGFPHSLRTEREFYL
jgi:cell division protein ZapA